MALLGRNSRVFGYAGLQDNESTRLLLRKTTSLQDYETTSGAVAGGASPELRNYGITDLWIYGFMDLRIYGFWFRCVGQRTMATLCYARQLVYETTSGAVAGGASPELRNHGLTELWNYG